MISLCRQTDLKKAILGLLGRSWLFFLYMHIGAKLLLPVEIWRIGWHYFALLWLLTCAKNRSERLPELLIWSTIPCCVSIHWVSVVGSVELHVRSCSQLQHHVQETSQHSATLSAVLTRIQSAARSQASNGDWPRPRTHQLPPQKDKESTATAHVFRKRRRYCAQARWRFRRAPASATTIRRDHNDLLLFLDQDMNEIASAHLPICLSVHPVVFLRRSCWTLCATVPNAFRAVFNSSVVAQTIKTAIDLNVSVTDKYHVKQKNCTLCIFSITLSNHVLDTQISEWLSHPLHISHYL